MCDDDTDADDYGLYDDSEECQECGGLGYVDGYKIADYYDFGWIDPKKTYPCRHCGGRGIILGLDQCATS